MWHRIRQYKTFMAPSFAKTFLYHKESTMSRRNTKVKPSSSWSKKNKSIFRANIWVSLCQIWEKKPRNYIHFEFGFFKSFFNWVGFYLRHGNRTTVRYKMHKTTYIHTYIYFCFQIKNNYKLNMPASKLEHALQANIRSDSARWKTQANKLLDNFFIDINGRTHSYQH